MRLVPHLCATDRPGSWVLFVIGLACLLPAFPAWADFELHINSGGSPLTLTDGTEYVGDGPYSVEQGYGWLLAGDYINWRTVGGCIDPRLYKSFHSATGNYRIDVPNGDYLLTLNFCEAWSHRADNYTMDWWSEGNLLLEDLDVYAHVEKDYALDYRFAVTVNDGQLYLDDVPHPHTQICGISVLDHEPDAIAPAPPVLTEILGGYEQIILNWEDNEEEDVAGYRVYRRVEQGGQFVEQIGELNLVSRFVDNTLVPLIEYGYQITAVDAFGNESDPTGPFTAAAMLHEDSPLPVYFIEIDPDSLAMLNEDINADIYYSCTVQMGDSLYDAGLRYRGNVVRPLSKKSYKIKLTDADHENRTKFNCNSEMCDPCLMRSPLSMDLFRTCGVPAPTAQERVIVLNGEHMGVYCDVEQVDARFLQARDLDNGASIYKCFDRLQAYPDSLDYHENYDKETNEETPWADLILFIETLNYVADEEFYETFVDFLDIEEYLRYYAVLNTVNDGDAIVKNFYLCHDLDTDFWQMIPWDKDLSWGIRAVFLPNTYWTQSLTQGASPTGNMLAYRVMNEPVLKNTYASIIHEHLTELAPLEDIYAEIDTAHAVVEANGIMDVRKWFWEDNERFTEGDAEIDEFATERYAFMLANLEALVTPQDLYINEFMADNETTLSDEVGQFDDWLEIYNPRPTPVNLNDYFLTDELDDSIQWQFPDTTIAGLSHVIVWVDNDQTQGPLHTNFKLKKEGERIALHKKEPDAGDPVDPDDIDLVDLVFFGAQTTDVSRARISDGDYRWAFDPDPTPGTFNDVDQGIDGPALDGIWTAAPSLHAWPNPFTHRVSLHLDAGTLADIFEIFDVGGRLCRRVQMSRASDRWVWDGCLETGQFAPPGLYVGRARISDARSNTAPGGLSHSPPTVRLLYLR